MGGPGGGAMTEDQEKSFLLWGRYLGPDGKPIPFGGGGATAAPGEPAAAAPTEPPGRSADA